MFSVKDSGSINLLISELNDSYCIIFLFVIMCLV